MDNKNKKDIANFKINRVEEIKEMYADESSTNRRFNRTNASGRSQVTTAAGVRTLLQNAISNNTEAVKLSKQLYATNPIYAQVIDYLSNMFMWRYKVTPHKIYTKSVAKAKKTLKQDDYMSIYHLMLEVADGLSIETKFPLILSYLFIEGAVYLTTVSDEQSIAIDTIILPSKYCRKIGETQYGTAIIEFDFSYFDDVGLTADQLKNYLKSFPDDFAKRYNKYKKDQTNFRWQRLDPHFSTGLLLNEYAVPTFLYLWGGILDYEQYQDDELARHEDMLHYLVVQTMPHYEDKLLFEMDEVKALHQSMRRKIDQGDRVKLVTTFGDIKVARMAESDTVANEVLSNAFKAIFNNAGFNSGIFTDKSVEALKMSLIRDRGFVWKFVRMLISFYNIAINNWYDFKNYQADIDILQISSYNYNDDIKVFKDNATLGVGKIDYIVASGIKQKDIEDMLELEKMLKVDRITPMQTAYTQSAEDRQETGEKNSKSNDSTQENEKSEIEPSDNSNRE